MNKKEYLRKRNALLQEAQSLINEGKVKEAEAKRKEIETLDADYESAATEAANIAALTNQTPAPVAVPLITGEKIDHLSENNIVASDTYKNAFFKRLMNRELSQDEKLAYSSGADSAGATIPTETMNKIMTKLTEYAPLLSFITLLKVPGNVKFVMEGTNNEASLHTENAEISASEDTVTEVTLGGYEITKLIQISDTVDKMSIPAFESWIVDMLAKAIANRITRYLISGTGSSQPTGVSSAAAWVDGSNAIEVAAGSNLTTQNVIDLISLLPGGYDPNARFIMNKKTLWQDFKPLEDDSKNKLVTREGSQWLIYGYPVELDSRVPIHEAYMGDFSYIVGNLPETVAVRKEYDIDTNSNKYLGVAIFDSKVSFGEAFVKLMKETQESV